MKTSYLFAPLLALFLGGCIYEAPVSLTPSREIDRSLLGLWDSERRTGNQLQISEADPHHYTISRIPSSNDLIKGPMGFLAHHTKVGDVDIVNAVLIHPKGDRWLLLSYTHPDADTIRIRFINDKVVPWPPSTQQGHPGGDLLITPDAMRKHIESVAQRPDLFRPEEMVFIRAKK